MAAWSVTARTVPAARAVFYTVTPTDPSRRTRRGPSSARVLLTADSPPLPALVTATAVVVVARCLLPRRIGAPHLVVATPLLLLRRRVVALLLHPLLFLPLPVLAPLL